MLNHKIIIFLRLLCLAIPLASAMLSAGHPASNIIAGAIMEVDRAHTSSSHTSHKTKTHSSSSHTKSKTKTHDPHRAQHTAVEIVHLNQDADNDTTDKTHPQNPTVENSINKKDEADINARNSDGSHADSSGISYDKNGDITNIPLGAGKIVYTPFGGIFDVPGWNSASVIDGYAVMVRAMALSVATALGVYLML